MSNVKQIPPASVRNTPPLVEVLARVLSGPQSEDCPATFLRGHPGLRVLADDAAAGPRRVP